MIGVSQGCNRDHVIVIEHAGGVAYVREAKVPKIEIQRNQLVPVAAPDILDVGFPEQRMILKIIVVSPASARSEFFAVEIFQLLGKKWNIFAL